MPFEGKGLFSGHNSNFDVSTASSKGAEKYDRIPDRLDWSGPLTDQHTKIYDTCNKYDAHLTKYHFDYIASNYEGMYLKMGYPDPKFVAKYVNKMVKQKGLNPSEVSVLDLGCGTGLVGKYLSE